MTKNKAIFQYYNRRKDGKHLEDCVCRAISTATGLKYYTIERLLEMSASYFACDKLCICCYHNLLEDVFEYRVHHCTNGETVEDIAGRYSDKKVIIRIQGHLTSAIYGTMLDIWDCSTELVDCFWIVE